MRTFLNGKLGSAVYFPRNTETWGLYKQVSLYLKKGLVASENIPDPNTSKQFKGQVYQEKGYYALNMMEYDQAVDYFKTAQFIFESLPESKNQTLFLSQTEEQLGKSF